jgi:hypothetical protein
MLDKVIVCTPANLSISEYLEVDFTFQKIYTYRTSVARRLPAIFCFV